MAELPRSTRYHALTTSVQELRMIVQGEAAPPDGMVQSLVLAHSRASNAMEGSGNVALHVLGVESGNAVEAGATYVESLP